MYIIMEYIQGNTLDRVLRESGPVDQFTVLQWALQLCDVLGYLHKQTPPYIYRDMKPANIVLKPCGNIMLLALGLPLDYIVLGNDMCVLMPPGYTSPEGFCGKIDQRSDIYSLGVTFHHLLTGIAPYEPPYETRPIREINPNLSIRWEKIILRCTESDPEKRFQSCDELKVALEGGPIYPPQKKRLFDKIFGWRRKQPR